MYYTFDLRKTILASTFVLFLIEKEGESSLDYFKKNSLSPNEPTVSMRPETGIA